MANVRISGKSKRIRLSSFAPYPTETEGVRRTLTDEDYDDIVQRLERMAIELEALKKIMKP